MNLADKLIEKNTLVKDKTCFVAHGKNVSYHDFYKMVSCFKDYLLSKDIKKGDKVLILVPMSLELYVSLFSIWSIGAVPCFMDAGFIKNGMKKNDFDDIKAVIGITKYILYSNINSHLRKLKLKINVNVMYSLKYTHELTNEALEDEAPGILTYTSGTTGKPKVAQRNHDFLNIQANILFDNLMYEENDIELSTMPIFTLSNINAGITTVVAKGNFSNLGKTNPKDIIKQIKDNNINRIMAAPGLLGIVSRYANENGIVLNNVTKIMTGGGAIFLDLINNIKKAFPSATILTAYGSTEAEPISKLDMTNLDEYYINKIKDGFGIPAGKIIGVDDCKTINTDKEELGEISKEEFERLITGDVGEIVVTGKNVLKGYVGGIGDAKNKFSVDGIKYHRTGDMGIFDERGELWLRGRKKEPFFNIEASLHAQFDIDKTAVFENEGKIILVLEKGSQLSESDIKDKIKFASIDEIKFVDKIPLDKRHSSKVDYNELRKILYK